MLRNLVTSLLRYERIQTTDPKAKELRRWADHMIGLGKEGTLHARRRALAVIQDEAVVHKLFDSLAVRFKDRPGGYSRVIKIGWRHGDSAPVSMVELLPAEAGAKAEAASTQKKGAKKPRQQAAAKAGAKAAKGEKKAAAPRRRAKKASA